MKSIVRSLMIQRHDFPEEQKSIVHGIAVFGIYVLPVEPRLDWHYYVATLAVGKKTPDDSGIAIDRDFAVAIDLLRDYSQDGDPGYIVVINDEADARYALEHLPAGFSDKSAIVLLCRTADIYNSMIYDHLNFVSPVTDGLLCEELIEDNENYGLGY